MAFDSFKNSSQYTSDQCEKMGRRLGKSLGIFFLLLIKKNQAKKEKNLIHLFLIENTVSCSLEERV